MFFALLAASMSCIFAQNINLDLRPGLWETTTISKATGMPSIDMSKMPPEARKRFEDTMAKRNQNPQPHTSRSCMTKEKLQRETFADQSTNQSCKRTLVTNTRNVVDVKIECANEKAPTSGTAHMEALSRESVKGNIKIAGAMTMDINLTSKWISDSCGDVK